LHFMALLNYPFRFVGGWVLMTLLGITDTSICQQSNTVVVELCYAVRKSSDSCCLRVRYNLQFSGGAGRKKKAFGTASGYLGLRIGALPSTTHSQFVGVEC